MKNQRALGFLFAFLCTLIIGAGLCLLAQAAFGAITEIPPGPGSAGGFIDDGIPAQPGAPSSILHPPSSPLRATTWLIIALAPALVAVAKAFFTFFGAKIPKPLLPVLATALGVLLDYLNSLIGGGAFDPAIGAALGGAGVGLRELIDQVKKSQAARAAAFLLAACTVGATLWLTACVHLDPGADPFVVRVETTQKMARSTLDLVLHLDNQDRGFWRTNAPAFHELAEWLRTPTPYQGTNIARCLVIELQVDDAKAAYKGARTAGNSNTLYAAWAGLDTVLSQATSWATIVTNKVHP